MQTSQTYKDNVWSVLHKKGYASLTRQLQGSVPFALTSAKNAYFPGSFHTPKPTPPATIASGIPYKRFFITDPVKTYSVSELYKGSPPGRIFAYLSNRALLVLTVFIVKKYGSKNYYMRVLKMCGFLKGISWMGFEK